MVLCFLVLVLVLGLGLGLQLQLQLWLGSGLGFGFRARICAEEALQCRYRGLEYEVITLLTGTERARPEQMDLIF